MSKKVDKLYNKDLGSPPEFQFDKRVAEVFEDMITRSVPGYTQILNLLPILVAKISKQESFEDVPVYYDLGCSLGAGMLSIANGLAGQGAHLIGVDKSIDMLEQASTHLAHALDSETLSYELIHAEISHTKFVPARMILMNFTLQFIDLKQRDALAHQLYETLEPGGVLVLSEKIRPSDPDVNQLLIDIHHLFKAEQGYSDLEIANKRDAIENVLLPESYETHFARLQSAGFKIITPWIQNLQFISILAVK